MMLAEGKFQADSEADPSVHTSFILQPFWSFQVLVEQMLL